MNNTPKLRFKEFENEWKHKKINKIAKLTSSKRIYAEDYKKNGVPFYRGKEISEIKQGKLISDVLYISKEKYFEIKNKYGVPQRGDILITAVGTLGNSLLIKNDFPFYFKDGNLIWFKDIKEDSVFLDYLISSCRVQRKILNSAIGSTQKALTIVELNKINLIIPSLPEQKKIASFLSLFDEKIELQEKKIKSLEKYKKGMMQKIFSQEIRFKDENGENYPEWETTTIEKIANIKKGFTPNTKDDSLWNGDIDWLSIGDMKECKYITKSKKTINNKGLKNNQLTPKGTLIMSFKLTLGKMAILGKDMVTNEAICHFYWKNNNINNEFMYYNMSNINISTFGSRAVKGITLNSDNINSIIVKIPYIKEQEKIANFLSTIDSKIELEQKKLDKLKEYKKGLLQQMFV